jgi:hypothetical protein
MTERKVPGGVVHKITDDIKKVIISSDKAFVLWESLTPLARNEWICWVTSVKKEETRADHVKRLVIELNEGKRRPCCWLGCIHRKDKAISPSVQGILNRKLKIKS